ncbi:sulfhydryl oxidase 1-like [Babylonia areolata]|uniref:sulfhydryl oxidase 1-like n=1 Tax=Babylonia areolata TaxID=304850 RepID=UPI003FD47338
MCRVDRWFHLIAILWLFDSTGLNGRAGLWFVRAKPRKREGLYSADDDVIVLNIENFRERVSGKSMVWVIEFYNSWCGHCVKYAPTWKNFASDLKGWRRVVSVGAIDCSDERNLEVCREYEIESYPCIKMFPPGFNPDTDKDKLTLISHTDEVSLKAQILNYVTKPEFTAPPTWPRLSPLRSLGDIWNEATDEHKLVVVVFEEENSIVGREVILDLVDFPGLLVRCMLREAVEKFGSFTYPSLYTINRDSSFQLLARGGGMVDTDRHAFVNKLLSLLHFEDSEGKRIHIDQQQGVVKPANAGNVVQFEQEGEEKGVKKKEEGEEEEKKSPPVTVVNSQPASKGVHLQDLLSGLHYAFRQEVAICKTIDGAKLDALRNFVSVLAKFFPGSPQVSQFLWKLVELLRGQEQLTGESWVKLIEGAQDKDAFLPDKIRWVGCRGSHPGYRGYPCSMWTLFHTLTVAAYEHTGSAVNAQEVPLAVRGYMEHFFGCQECSRNFLRMAASMERDIHRPLDAVLWLWAAHNKANRRLHGEPSEDPQHPKVQFPSAQDCPPCHRPQSVNPPYTGWDAPAVALFLVRFYGKDGIILDAATTAEDEEGEEKESEDGAAEEGEMDWWEKQQRQQDLKKIRELREQKKKRKLEQTQQREARRRERGEEVEGGRGRRGGGARRQQGPDVIKESVHHRQLGEGWGLNSIDVGVCLVFYVSCAIIILILYYHFVVQRRFRLPCKNWMPV